MGSKRKSEIISTDKRSVRKMVNDTIGPNDIKHLDCKKPLFRKTQRVFEETGTYFIDTENAMIVSHNILDQEELNHYVTKSLDVERESSFSGFAMKPRYEVCYTPDGTPYEYSNQKHHTSKYPQHVLDLIPKFKDVINHNLGKITPYAKLSTGVDILYSDDFPRGGSISAHRDYEMDWGLVIIYSLGQSRWLRVRNSETKQFYNIKVPHNSLVAMHGPTFQKNYTHQVDKLSKDEPVGNRLSLNIRFLKEQ